MLWLLALSVASIAAAAKAAVMPVGNRKPRCKRKLPASVVAIARKWAAKCGLPLSWVLTTIMLESCGDPMAVGDTGGRSVGYMQVNTVAHAARMQKAGLTREKMFDPETNIMWGTQIMLEARNAVQQALAAKQVTATAPQLGQITRLYYKGPQYVLNAIAAGKDPRTSLPWAPPALHAWDATLVETQAFV